MKDKTVCYRDVGRIIATGGNAKSLFEELLESEEEHLRTYSESVGFKLIEDVKMSDGKTLKDSLDETISQLEAAVENPSNANINTIYLYGSKCSILKYRKNSYVFTLAIPKRMRSDFIRTCTLRIAEDLLRYGFDVDIHL